MDENVKKILNSTLKIKSRECEDKAAKDTAERGEALQS